MSQNSNRRVLTQQEIYYLVQKGCSATDWNQILVCEDFKADSVSNVRFSGAVFMGRQFKTVTLPGGLTIPCGIYNAAVHNCSIGDNVLIRNVSDVIANMQIDSDVIINNVASIIVDGASTFGNGVELALLNENAGRAVPIIEGWNAQIAYLMTMYRHRPELINKLRKLIFEHVNAQRSHHGWIGAGVRIQHCGQIKNVQIGPAAVLEGLSRLDNGTVASCTEDPVYIGQNVVAEDFIFEEGAKITDGVILKRGYAGQGVRLEKGFSAVDSAFFANSHFEQSEACSVFAGPYSASHHKAGLMIAGYYSFYNAGSGTNNSNHMYKLGPIHQGILERGCKSGSDSCLVFPLRIGAFTTIIGKHEKRADLSDLPFSCLLFRHGRSVLFPALNLTGIGLVRDEQKWRMRDDRRAAVVLDQVNAAVFTPYTAQKMQRGIKLLQELREKHPDALNVVFHGIEIHALERGIEWYQLALDAFYGSVLSRRALAILHTYRDEIKADKKRHILFALKEYLRREVDLGTQDWVDIAGLITPADALQQLLEDIEDSRIDSLRTIHERMASLNENFREYEWAWAARQLERNLGKHIPDWTAEDFSSILERGLHAARTLTAQQIEDARKEFAPESRIGYGIDGDSEIQDADFEAVCGRCDDNKTITMLREKVEEKRKQVQEILSLLKEEYSVV